MFLYAVNFWNKLRKLIQKRPLHWSFGIFLSFFYLKLALWKSVPNEIPLVSTAVAIIALSAGLRFGLFFTIPAFFAEFYFFTPEDFSIMVFSPNIILNLVAYGLVLVFIALSFGSQYHLEEEMTRVLNKQNEWIGIASHELKTPVSGIIGINRILKSRLTGAEDRRYLELVEHSTWQLNKTVTNLLDLSKLSSSHAEIEIVNFSISESMKSIAEIFQLAAQEKSIRFIVPEFNENIFVKGDQYRFQQVLSNILENAIKYTPSYGKVVLSYQLENNNDEVVLEVRVADTGSGIAEQEFNQIFTPFYRVSNTKKSVDGTGLGLAICKRIVDKLGGTIGVRSTVAIGSEFWFKIPFKTQDFEQRKKIEKQGIFPREFSRRRVLVAEDNEINQMVILQDLMNLNLDIKMVPDGQKAVDICRYTEFDFILLDCQMPDLDGFAAATLIRQNFTRLGQRVPPIIGFTADTTEICRQKALASGMDFLIYKPIQISELRSLLSEILPVQNFDIRKYFFSQKEARLQELFDLLDRQDWQNLKQKVHYLRSSCLAIEHADSAGICERVEHDCENQHYSNIPPCLESLRATLDQLELLES